MPEQGDIVLLPVPFSDLSANKRRPAIVVSNNAYHLRTQDMIVVALTSSPATVPHSFVITNTNLRCGTLNRPGTVRVDRIYSLSQQLIVRVFGRVDDKTLERIRGELAVLMSSLNEHGIGATPHG